MVGVEERFLAKAVRNCIQTKTAQQLEILRIHRRFYTALVLQELMNEIPLPVISKRYKINKGMLQSLQNSSATFAGMLTVFCHKLGWTCLELLLEQFQSRLTFGVSRELCNLVRISLLSGFKARLLYDRGYESVSTLAFANKDDIANLLRESVPFESKRLGEKSDKSGTKINCRNIWLIGKEGLTEYEAAELIIMEAQKVLRADAAALGLSVHALNDKVEDSSQVTCSSVSHTSGRSNKRNSKSFLRSNKRTSKKDLTIEDASNKNKSPDAGIFSTDLVNRSIQGNKENCTQTLNEMKRKAPIKPECDKKDKENLIPRNCSLFTDSKFKNGTSNEKKASPLLNI